MTPSCQAGENPAVSKFPEILQFGSVVSLFNPTGAGNRSGVGVLKIPLSLNRTDLPFFRGVVLPVLFAAVATLSLGAASILWAVQKSNEVSAERQLRTTDRSIRAAVQELAQQQEMVAVWDDAVLELRRNQLDLKWLDANLGVWLVSKALSQEQITRMLARLSSKEIQCYVGGSPVFKAG